MSLLFLFLLIVTATYSPAVAQDLPPIENLEADSINENDDKGIIDSGKEAVEDIASAFNSFGLDQEMCENANFWNIVAMLLIAVIFSVIAWFIRKMMARRAIMTHQGQIMLLIPLVIILCTGLSLIYYHMDETIIQCLSSKDMSQYILLNASPIGLKEFLVSGLSGGVLAFLFMIIFRN